MIFTSFERMVAWRYLRAKRGESFMAVIVLFSLVGIALGVATLIVVMSVMNGVRDEMLQHFVGLSGHVQIYGAGHPLADYRELTAEIARQPGIERATPLVEGQVMVTANNQARGVQVRAMPEVPAYLRDKLVTGDISTGGILLGERLAQSLGVRIGDKVTFISPDGRQTVLGLVPRLKAYPVAGIFKFGMHSIDASLVVMPFDEAQRFFKLADAGQDNATSIEIRLNDIDAAGKVADTIGSQLGSNFRVYDWQQTNAAVFEALKVQQVVMFLILMLIILVAAFNIISSLIMLVKDKQRDIAILRSMGATRQMVQGIFMLSGLSVGLIGTLTGLVLGLLLAFHVDDIRLWIEAQTGQRLLGEQLYFLASLPAKVEWMEVGMVVVMSLTLSLLATIYPARRAAALDPAEALRYE